MAEIRHLPNAPITEALIDIRTKLPKGFDISGFENLSEKALERLPKKEVQSEYSAKLNIKEKNISTDPEQTKRGVFYRSEDEKNIVQFRRDGFTFNRLKPYTNWEDIIDEAKTYWQIYQKHGQPVKITRLGTRYINHIKLPLPINDFSDYMTSPPQIPEGMPNLLNSYLSKISLQEPSNQIHVNVIQAIEKGEKDKYITLIFDTDSFINKMFEPDSNIWSKFDDLRKMKNKVFFNSLTEKTINLFL